MEECLRPCVEAVALRGGEVSLGVANRDYCDYALAGDPGRATTLGWICEVDCVALIEKVGSPARTVVGCVEEVLGLGIRVNY